MVTIEDVKAARKEYTQLLKLCVPSVDEYPRDLLRKLDKARLKWITLKKLYQSNSNC